MGLLALFANRKSGDGLPATHGGDDQQTTVEYIDWLVTHMLRTSCTELTIDSTRPLPGADEPAPELAPPCLPSHQAVLNKLKLLSGLNPVRCADPTTGHFERARGRFTLIFGTVFEDAFTHATCAIRLRVRPG